MSCTNTTHTDWADNLKNAYAIHNVLSSRSELPFFIIKWNGEKHIEWMELSDPRHQPKPYHFEIYFGKESVRDAHYLEALKAARARDQVVLRNIYGFWDLFYKLPADSSGQTFLFAGQFLQEAPKWTSLCKNWRELTGQEPVGANRDFVKFVRMTLSLPVLEPDLLKAFKKFVKLYGKFLSGKAHKNDIQRDVDQLNTDVLSRLWPIDDWVNSVLSSDKFRLPLWYYDGELADWIKEGMGIVRLPTTAMSLLPIESRSQLYDPAQALLRNAQIQRACIAFVRNLPETAATRLQDYGISIITSSKKGKSRARARLELKERAERLRAYLAERFHVHSVVGIGRTQNGGTSLYESHKEAVLAAHMCVQLGKNVLFHDELDGRKRLRYTDLQKLADTLVEVLDRQNSAELKVASDLYITVALQYANDRIEVARGQFLATLFQLLKSVKRKNPMRESAFNSFVLELTSRVEAARSIEQVIESFNGAIQRLSFVSDKVWRGSSVMLLESTLQYLKDNYFENLPLPMIARKTGFSVPAFTRVFKQATGTSYLSYLRSIRVEQAKKLLTSTPDTIEQIAQACGFHSQHHLIRSFKKVAGQTPGAYRDAHAIRGNDS
ncbi:MAG: AraC family transcriptional regulator [Myxococcota bacterium]|nr:AraC family transcriptional regulator [Myxococcota bacterium]